MSSDPRTDQPDDEQRPRDSEDPSGDGREFEDGEHSSEETSGRNTSSRFQQFVDEAGRRFREALDRLA